MCVYVSPSVCERVCGSQGERYSFHRLFIRRQKGTLSYPCLKKFNALTFKLKTHLGEVGGQEQCAKAEVEKEEEEGSPVEEANIPVPTRKILNFN